ncbi:leucine-rich repeat protein [Silvanigrella paludirubra]|uniref:Leucine-rich repeat protein n=1 Tax=Silvanigrella paludirubra TaxID=2499159 RepID=A0A6N6VRU1_9BACT|nr:leucine-rich repeat protein [Silvanigrella paludirubra]KAB8038660.1 leucine-rich repeat protein [Silvanigrella paludirubra]
MINCYIKKISFYFLLIQIFTHQIIYSKEQIKNNISKLIVNIPNNGLTYLFQEPIEEGNPLKENVYVPKDSNNNFSGISNEINDYELFSFNILDENDDFLHLNELSIKYNENNNNSYFSNENCKKISFSQIQEKFYINNFPKNLTTLLNCDFTAFKINKNKNKISDKINFNIKINYSYNRWLEIAKSNQNSYLSPALKIALNIDQIQNKNNTNIHLKPSPNSIIYSEYLDLSPIYKINIFPDMQKLTIEGYRIEQANSFNAFLFPKNEKLTQIIYSSNILPEINSFSFSKLTNIETIDLIGNKIRKIDDKAFYKLSKVKEIKLDYNNELYNNENSKDKKYQFFCNLTSLNNYENLYKINCDGDSKKDKDYVYDPKKKELIIQGNQFQKLDLLFLNKINFRNDIQKIIFHRFFIDFRVDSLANLSNLLNLKELEFIDTKINEIVSESFNGLNLERITFKNNDIGVISESSFNNLNNLKEINISGNRNLRLAQNSFKNLINIEKISITNSNLDNILDDVFGNLPKLKNLNLEGNNIKKIHKDAFIYIYSLDKLYLSNNSISDLEFISQNLKISKLNLSKNNIEIINYSIYIKNIEFLDLSFNKIKELDHYSFYYLNTLKYLNLNNNPITRISERAFYLLPNLEVLSIKDSLMNELNHSVLSSQNLPKLMILDLNNQLFTKKYNLKSAFGHICRPEVNYEKYYFTCI